MKTCSPVTTNGRGPETTKWPFMFVAGADGRHMDWIVLHAPIQSATRVRLFADYRQRGFGFVGMTSFAKFPAVPGHSNLDYACICQGWAHCFREPDRYLPVHQPRCLLSLSDFTDPLRIAPHRFSLPEHEADRFDFVYVGANQPWKKVAKNLPLAQRCLPRLCSQLGLRGLVVGMDPGHFRGVPGLVVRPWLPYDDWLRILAASRFLFVPNVLDASPRVMAEALCLDVPVLVNRTLLGGWKYVAEPTGVFFDSENDVVGQADRLLNRTCRPRPWFLSQFGPQRAGRMLLTLLRQIDPGLAAKAPLRLTYSVAGGPAN